uniref:Uncharacterized protein n=1 Tax=Elaeophora elaphi TaxID=1147741 RepID=A0A0R3RIY4_9BILA
MLSFHFGNNNGQNFARDQYNLTDNDICDHINTLMANSPTNSSSDAVSAQVGVNFFALGHRQHCQEKVYEEIKHVLDETERDITIDDVKSSSIFISVYVKRAV